MALTGLEIYKQLPKKNCGECGPPTCLAFAMQLASGKASLDACPYVTEEAKEALASAAAPPIKLVKIGAGDTVLETGDETVIFRHDKTFLHPTGIFIEVDDTLSKDDLEARIGKIKDLVFERVGQQYRVDGLMLRSRSGDVDAYRSALDIVYSSFPWALIIDVGGFASVAGALETLVREFAAARPLLYAADESNYEVMTQIARENDCPLAVKADGLDALADLVQKITGLGYKELVLDPSRQDLSPALADLTQIRRLAIKKKFRPLGYPTIAFAQSDDPDEQVIEATMYVAKFSSILVTKATERHQILPLLTWRANIFTDPQKPIQVESKVSTVGNVTEESPVLVTTNFSLTYYSVEGEVEASKVPAYILPVNTEGTSVLTAWAAGKFSAETISAFVKECGIEQRVNHRNLVLPGHVAVLSGKLQDLSGWKVIVGPKEASGIPAFMKAKFAS